MKNNWKSKRPGRPAFEDKEVIRIIMNHIRLATLVSPIRKEVLNSYSKKVYEGNTERGNFKNGKLRFKKYWTCPNCKKDFRDEKALEVDHIVEIGGFKGDWNEIMDRAFCPPEEQQTLCIECHKRKTTSSARERFSRKKRVR